MVINDHNTYNGRTKRDPDIYIQISGDEQLKPGIGSWLISKSINVFTYWHNC